jgi:hypothetical protein
MNAKENNMPVIPQIKKLKRLHKKLEAIDHNCVGWVEVKEYALKYGVEETIKELQKAING